MQIFYSDQPLPEVYNNSIFLAGPTPRKDSVQSWRIEAVELLNELNFDGQVFIPERKDWTGFDYNDQIVWEQNALNNCSSIVFWVPRQFPDMPAFTTNVEFGLYIKYKGSIYGRPNDAVKCEYLDWIYKTYRKLEPSTTLINTLKKAIEIIPKTNTWII